MLKDIPKDKKLTLADLRPSSETVQWEELENFASQARGSLFEVTKILKLIKDKTKEDPTLEKLATILSRDTLKQHERLDHITQTIEKAKQEGGNNETYIVGTGLSIQNECMDVIECNERLIKPQVDDILIYLNNLDNKGEQDGI